ncbi:putative iron-sulfur cluster assembly accessory protein [Toxoplasma gondii TgCatPRC2]|uniref:Iron-sulfur cluster assembly accessory protein n=5 Tax=Toxoplasma gondii TaxID=5811 RepID=S7VZ18_TOXGG|nr:hypothetical protein TGME49_318170 [Toxoplasma gondii ME49]EPR58233.1 hypothetical protein TGGT1_318170 [Toxoplasma gondii GT1]KAF4645019.1 hypothetical protein TGRH88_008350 [Toxoplasma gondii]KYF39506.1 putative iron-sulfur cluster assembly accessory protein [Toxoplasma gondii ARI]KYK66952.1 putative iron-sulfur cluster assembly accessory protein [Toxoplasma gondii TgCatPRC2]EPT31431.1 hypothetical protein TGME49_318170 [Toxoplasma gondii ME49]|eukprot:XP_002369756.2 hypothetical protein TGME49_318170 [Toxoplasma gondii ME49]
MAAHVILRRRGHPHGWFFFLPKTKSVSLSSPSTSPLICYGEPCSFPRFPCSLFSTRSSSAFAASAVVHSQGRQQSGFTGVLPQRKLPRAVLTDKCDDVSARTSSCRFFAHDAGSLFSFRSPREEAFKASGGGQTGRLMLKGDGDAVIHMSPAAVKRLTEIWAKRRETEALADAAASQTGSAAGRMGAIECDSPVSHGVYSGANRAASVVGVPGQQDGGSTPQHAKAKNAIFDAHVSPTRQCQQRADRGGRGSGDATIPQSETAQQQTVEVSSAAKGSTRSSGGAPRLGLLVRVISGGCSGYQYCFNLVGRKELLEFRQAGTHLFFRMASPHESLAIDGTGGLETVEGRDSSNELRENGWCVVVDKCSVPLLENSVVDYSDTLAASEFRIVNNEQAENVCSCGHSFAIKDDF